MLQFALVARSSAEHIGEHGCGVFGGSVSRGAALLPGRGGGPSRRGSTVPRSPCPRRPGSRSHPDFDALGGRSAGGPERGDDGLERYGEVRRDPAHVTLGTRGKNVPNNMDLTPKSSFGPRGVVTLVP